MDNLLPIDSALTFADSVVVLDKIGLHGIDISRYKVACQLYGKEEIYGAIRRARYKERSRLFLYEVFSDVEVLFKKLS